MCAEDTSRQTVVVATHNAHKVAEIHDILGDSDSDWQLVSLDAAGVHESALEDADSFAGNALLKARFAHQRTGLAALADDSGLVVDALDGAPGVYSSRYAGEDATDEDNLNKLLAALDNVPEERRTARFVCAVAFITASGEEHLASGVLNGRIATAPSGQGGFGYDPVFIPELHAPAGDTRTLAEYRAVEKNAISHRARALLSLADELGLQPAAEPQPAPAPPPTTEPQHTAAAPPPAQPSAAAPPPQPTTNPVRIVAFDFDGTLIDASSPVRLIFRLTRERIMPVLVGMRIGIWGARYKMGSELDQSLPRGIIFRSLRRVSAADADALLRSLYREELRQSLRPQALEELARHKRDGAEVLIASASFEPIISEVARDLGADGFISTQMEVADGCYTGKTIGEPPEGEQKLLQLKQYADERYGVGNWVLEWAYGDHFSDIPLLEGATHAVAVDPDRRLDRIARSRGWSIVEWELPGGREVTIGADIIASLLGKAPKRPGGPKTADRRRKR